MKTRIYALCLVCLVCSAACNGEDFESNALDAESIALQGSIPGDTPSAAPDVVHRGFHISHAFAGQNHSELTFDTIMPDGGERWRSHGGMFYSRAADFVSIGTRSEAVVKPFLGTADEHGAAVKDLFLEAGLPEDQIESVTTGVTARMPFSSEIGQAAVGKLESYTTVIRRQIHGMPINGSFVVGRINDKGEVTLQVSYWPPVPHSLIVQANALRQAASDPSSSLRRNARWHDGSSVNFEQVTGQPEVYLAPFSRAGSRPRAVWRVSRSGPNAPDARFDRSGTLLTLANASAPK